MILKRVLLIAVIWLGWAYLTFTEPASKSIDLASLDVASGKVVAATCVVSRSLNGVKLIVKYDDRGLQDEYVNLPGAFHCSPELETAFVNKPITVSRFENRILGLEIGDMVIRNSQEEVAGRALSRGERAYLTATAILATLFTILKTIARSQRSLMS